MGNFDVKKFESAREKAKYIDQLLTDIEALEHMLKNDMVQTAPIHIGAEQEFCLVDENWMPTNNSQEILATIDDPHFTTELTRFSLEINLDPKELKEDCFSMLHKDLRELLGKAEKAAAEHNSKVILTGILPTIGTKHISLDHMTPIKRYSMLNEVIREVRKDDIELHIKGVDEFNMHHGSIMYEGCNTSFQSHLQIDPNDFADTYNWAQAIAGPLLSICVNSPLLQGRELWEETRIALFTQSVDTRASSFFLNERESRVSFGSQWATGSASDFYKDSVARFRSLLGTTNQEDSMAILKEGKFPKLHALNLHNGTVYKWNRLCYGLTKGKPHLRIENRYMPSGPTTEDEIANMMLWVGVMSGRSKEYDAIHTKMHFNDIKCNFFNAARYGMGAQFYWKDELISSQDLLLDHLLPMAYRGLYRMGVHPKDAEHYLSIIEKRIQSKTGSRWIVETYRELKKDFKTPEALRLLVATMYKRRKKKYTVDAWQIPNVHEGITPEEQKTVEDVMTTHIITAQEKDSAALVSRMMEWNNIHHTPILDDNLDLAGIFTATDLKKHPNVAEIEQRDLKSLMQTKIITVTPDTKLSKARALMQEHGIRSLPVVNGKKLVGIVTSNDI